MWSSSIFPLVLPRSQPNPEAWFFQSSVGNQWIIGFPYRNWGIGSNYRVWPLLLQPSALDEGIPQSHIDKALTLVSHSLYTLYPSPRARPLEAVPLCWGRIGNSWVILPLGPLLANSKDRALWVYFLYLYVNILSISNHRMPWQLAEMWGCQGRAF